MKILLATVMVLSTVGSVFAFDEGDDVTYINPNTGAESQGVVDDLDSDESEVTDSYTGETFTVDNDDIED